MARARKESTRRAARTDVQTDDPIYDSGRSPYGCPECGGALWEADEGPLLRFRCRIGHGFNGESLLSAQDDGVEDALWTALRALEETSALRRRMSQRSAEGGLNAIAKAYQRRADEADRKAASIRRLIEVGELRAADVPGTEGPGAALHTRSEAARGPRRASSDGPRQARSVAGNGARGRGRRTRSVKKSR